MVLGEECIGYVTIGIMSDLRSGRDIVAVFIIKRSKVGQVGMRFVRRKVLVEILV